MTANDSATAPRSRRERPAKPALTRRGIIDAALVILREEGLNRVTMRRIAAALDTGPASLYVYVRDTEDLHAQILDALIGPLAATVAPPSDAANAPNTLGPTTTTTTTTTTGTWRDRLKTLLTGYRDILFTHPEIARMALSTQPSGPNYLALADTILGLLGEGGVSDQAAALGVDLLLLYPTAIAAEHAPRSPARDAADLSSLREQIATADPTRYPHVVRLGDLLVSGDGATRSDWAFNVLLDGILAASRTPTE